MINFVARRIRIEIKWQNKKYNNKPGEGQVGSISKAQQIM